MTDSIPQYHLFELQYEGNRYEGSFHTLEEAFKACVDYEDEFDLDYEIMVATPTGMLTIDLYQEYVFSDTSHDIVRGWKLLDGTKREMQRVTVTYPKPISVIKAEIEAYLKAEGVEDVRFTDVESHHYEAGRIGVTLRLYGLETQRYVTIDYIADGTFNMRETFKWPIEYLKMTPDQRAAWEASRPNVTGAW